MITQTSWQSQGMWTQPRSQLWRRCWSCSQIPCITRLKIWPVIKYFKYLLCHLSVLGQSVNGLKLVSLWWKMSILVIYLALQSCACGLVSGLFLWQVYLQSPVFVLVLSQVQKLADDALCVPGASLGLIWVFTRSLCSHQAHTWHRPQNGAWTDNIVLRRHQSPQLPPDKLRGLFVPRRSSDRVKFNHRKISCEKTCLMTETLIQCKRWVVESGVEVIGIWNR